MSFRAYAVPAVFLMLGCSSTSDLPSPGCADGIKNGDEASIDCGGACGVCSTIDALTPTWAVADESYVGLLTLTLPEGDGSSLELVDGPDNMVVDRVSLRGRDVGELSWRPLIDQGGSHPVTIRLRSGTAVVEQQFTVEVAGVDIAKTAPIGSAGGTVAVADELSPLFGISVEIPAGILSEQETISIGAVTSAVPLPEDATLAGPLFYLGPSGLTFNDLAAQPPRFADGTELQDAVDAIEAAEQPVTVTIPGFAEADEQSQLVLLTLQPDTRGYLTWVYVDAAITTDDDGVTLTAKLGHFSIFAVATIPPFPAGYRQVECEQAPKKIEALRGAWAIAQAATDEKLSNCTRNLVNPAADSDTALWPRGPKSCSTHADALVSDLNADPVVNKQFSAEKVNSGFIKAGASVPITHYLAWLKPTDGVGPSFLIDRYVGARMHVVRSSMKPLTPAPGTNDSPPGSQTYEALMQGLVQRYFLVDTITETADEVFDAWEEEIATTVRGRVVDTEDNPRQNAEVSLEQPVGYTAMTEDDGTFSIPGVPACGMDAIVVNATAGDVSAASATTEVVMVGDTDVGDIVIESELHWLVISRRENAPVYTIDQDQTGHQECLTGMTGAVITMTYTNTCPAAVNDLYVVGFSAPQLTAGFNESPPPTCGGGRARQAVAVSSPLTPAEVRSTIATQEAVDGLVHKFCTVERFECHKDGLSALPTYRHVYSHTGERGPLSVSPITPDAWLEAAITEMGWDRPAAVYHKSGIRAGTIRETGSFSYETTILIDGIAPFIARDETGITLTDGTFCAAAGDVAGKAEEEVRTWVYLSNVVLSYK